MIQQYRRHHVIVYSVWPWVT